MADSDYNKRIFAKGQTCRSGGYCTPVTYLKIRSLRDAPVSGDHYSFYPYSNQSVVLLLNEERLRSNWTSYSGVSNITSYTVVDNVPYLNGWGFENPSKLSYPLDKLNHLVEKMYIKVTETNFNFGEDFAEAHKTMAFARDSVRKVVKVFSAIRRGDLRTTAHELGWSKSKIRRSRKELDKMSRSRRSSSEKKDETLLDQAEDLWLLSRYAVRPLVISAENAMAVAQEGLISKIPSLNGKVHVSVLDHWTYREQTDSETYSSPGVKFKHAFTARIEILDLEGIRNAATGTNSASLIWALLPLSFTVDWVLGIGDFIKATEVETRTRFNGGCQSLRVLGTFKRERHYQNYNNSYNDFSKYEWGINCYGRWVINAITMVLPRVKNPFNTGEPISRALDIFSLAHKLSK